MNVLQVHIEILDFDRKNPSELIDRFVINVTNESTERHNYHGIFGLADMDVSFCTSCKSGECTEDGHLKRIIAPGVFVIIFLSLITVIVAVVGVYMWRRAKRTSVTSKPSQVVRSSYENTVPLEDLAHNYDVLTAVSSHSHIPVHRTSLPVYATCS